MSVTKYVINEAGQFALVSKMSGIEHKDLAIYIDGPVVRAGFLGIYQDLIETYGESVTLNLRSSKDDGPIIQAAFEAGAVRKVMDHGCFNPSYVATSDPASVSMTEPTSLEDLIKLKVIR